MNYVTFSWSPLRLTYLRWSRQQELHLALGMPSEGGVNLLRSPSLHVTSFCSHPRFGLICQYLSHQSSFHAWLPTCSAGLIVAGCLVAGFTSEICLRKVGALAPILHPVWYFCCYSNCLSDWSSSPNLRGMWKFWEGLPIGHSLRLKLLRIWCVR